MWRKYFSISEKEQSYYIKWLDRLIEERTKAIIGRKFRNHYGGVARLIMALGEVEESRGVTGAKRAMYTRYRTLFPRHSAFKAALDSYM